MSDYDSYKNGPKGGSNQPSKAPTRPWPLYYTNQENFDRGRKVLDEIMNSTSGVYGFIRVKEKIPVSYTYICHADGSPVAMDVRFEPVAEYNRDKRSKTHRTIFKNFGGADSTEWNALANYDLLLPGNAPELAHAVWDHEAGKGPPVVVLWCEGEKTRAALAGLMAHEYALEKVKALGVRVVTSCWFNGFGGAKSTNFALTPRPHQPGYVKVAGVNDRVLDLDKCVRHVFVRDADTAGSREAAEVRRRFREEYRVDPRKLVMADPPHGVGQGCRPFAAQVDGSNTD